LLFPVPSGDNGRDEDFALSKEWIKQGKNNKHKRT
jgi:hypothetical protein